MDLHTPNVRFKLGLGKRTIISTIIVAAVAVPAVTFAIDGLNHTDDTKAAVACAPNATKIANAVCLQDMNDKVKASMKVETQYTLKDSRDGKSYYVSKLKDGNVWMTQNLDLGATSKEIALTADDTDISPSSTFKTLPKATETIKNSSIGSVDNIELGNKYVIPSQTKEKMFNNTKSYEAKESIKSSGNRHYHVGNYYNYYAAGAGSYPEQNKLKSDTIAPDSICPAGWKLPSKNNYINLWKKHDIYGTDPTIYGGNSNPRVSRISYWELRQSPFYYIVGGSGISQLGMDGSYWVSNAMTNLEGRTKGTKGISSLFISLFMGIAWFDQQSSNYYGYLFSIRCVSRADATYTVKYNMNGGFGTLADSTVNSSHKQAKITLSKTVPTRKGYEFQGWATKSNATKANYAKGTTITLTSKTKTLYAVWAKLPTYKVTFDVNGGTGTVAAQSCTTTTLTGSCSVTIPATKPTKSGYKFLGWADSKTANTSAYAAKAKLNLSSNKTLYAVYVPSYVITYNANGGSNAPASQNCYPTTAQGSCSITVTANKPTRSSYRFLGWAESTSATSATINPNSNLTMTNDKTLYAVWQKLVNINTTVNGTGGTISESMQVAEGTRVTIKFTPDAGYKVASVVAPGIDTTNITNNQLVFTAGSTNVNVTVTFEKIVVPDNPTPEPENPDDPGTGPVTPGPEPVTFTASFDVNNGQGSVANQSCNTTTSSCTVVIPTNVPTRNNYRFLGWAESVYATTAAKQAGQTITLVGDKTLHAIWSPVHKLKLDLNSGTNVIADGGECASNRIGDSCTVTIPTSLPERDGYTFLGWAEADDATVADYQAGSQIELIVNKTINAVWKDNSIEEDTNGETGAITWQQGQEYVKGSDEDTDAIVKIDYPRDRLSEVLLDNNILDESKYTVRTGSTIITIDNEYLDTLDNGQHILQVNYNDGMTVSVEFEITEDVDTEEMDNWNSEPEEDTTTKEYTIIDSFIDQNFYNCVANAFAREFPNETIATTGLTNSQLAKIRTVNCSGASKDDSGKVTNLAGLEKLTRLTQLIISDNLISEIDVSHNVALTNLDIDNNSVSALNLSSNTALQELSASSNKLTALDIDRNEALISIDVSNNLLSALNIDNNPALLYLDASNNHLSAINTSHNTLLEELNVSQNGPTLTSISVDNNTALTWLDVSYNNLSSLNVKMNTALETLIIRHNQISEIDLSRNVELIDLIANENALRSLNLANNPDLETLYLSNNQLSSLDISHNTALKSVDVATNNLTNMNTASNILLEDLDVSSNALTELDITKNIALINLAASHNQLNELDVSQNTGLGSIDVSDNGLTTLDVSQNDILNELIADNILIKAGAKATTTNGAAVDFDMSSIRFLNFDIQTVEDTDDYTFNSDTKILNVKNYDENGTVIQISSNEENRTYKLQLTIKNNIEDDSVAVPNTGEITEENDGGSSISSVVYVASIVLLIAGAFLLWQKRAHRKFEF